MSIKNCCITSARMSSYLNQFSKKMHGQIAAACNMRPHGVINPFPATVLATRAGDRSTPDRFTITFK